MRLKDLKKIKNIETFGDTSLARFVIAGYDGLAQKYNLPSITECLNVGDPDKLWVECFDILNRITFDSGDVFEYEYLRGFLYDKASVPVGKDNILEAVNPTKNHDSGCSCHYLKFLEVHSDKGFRANNLLFYYSILWYLNRNKNDELDQYKIIKKNKKKGIKGDTYKERRAKRRKRFSIRVSYWFKRRRAKVWYRAVNSIVGQAFYEKNLREWHKKTTTFKHIKPEVKS